MNQFRFSQFARRLASLSGRPATFLIAVLVVALWALTGPLFGYSDTWQLVINTSTTIITFLMVFLIQNTQNRDNAAIQAKLDELLVHTPGAHNELATAENFTEAELRQLRKHFDEVAHVGGTQTVGGRLPAPVNRKKSPRKPAARAGSRAKS